MSSSNDFMSVCRTCLADNRNMLSTATKVQYEFGEDSLQRMLRACTSIEVTDSDGLPPQICDSCIASLIQCYTFRQQCLQVNKTLVALKSKEVDRLEPEAIEVKDEEEEEEEETELPTDSSNYFKIINVEEVLEKKDISKNSSSSTVYRPQPAEQQLKENDLLRPRNACETCGQTFNTNKDLKLHMLYHKKMVCPECSRSFKTSVELSIHLNTHTSNVLQCCFCNKTFTSRTHLKSHMRIHIKLIRRSRLKKMYSQFRDIFEEILEEMSEYRPANSYLYSKK